MCDKVDLVTTPSASRDPVRARRMTICDPGWTWDGDRMCYPTCPFGFETRDDLCIAVPHSYRRPVRPKLFRAPVTISLPNLAEAANREKVQSDFKHVVGETVADAKALVRAMYPELQIQTFSEKHREKVLRRPKNLHRVRLFFDPGSGLITRVPEIG